MVKNNVKNILAASTLATAAMVTPAQANTISITDCITGTITATTANYSCQNLTGTSSDSVNFDLSNIYNLGDISLTINRTGYNQTGDDTDLNFEISRNFLGSNILNGEYFDLTLNNLTGKDWSTNPLELAEFKFFNTGEFAGSNNLYVPTLTAVPLPASVWLFGSGLLGVAGMTANRRKNFRGRSQNLLNH